jgi:hypothetical protein
VAVSNILIGPHEPEISFFPSDVQAKLQTIRLYSGLAISSPVFASQILSAFSLKPPVAICELSGEHIIVSLTAEITQATGTLNDLRLQNADAGSIDAAKKRLGELKKAMVAINSAGGSKDAGKNKERLLLKTAEVCSSVHRPDSRGGRAHRTKLEGLCSALAA